MTKKILDKKIGADGRTYQLACNGNKFDVCYVERKRAVMRALDYYGMDEQDARALYEQAGTTILAPEDGCIGGYTGFGHWRGVPDGAEIFQARHDSERAQTLAEAKHAASKRTNAQPQRNQAKPASTEVIAEHEKALRAEIGLEALPGYRFGWRDAEKFHGIELEPAVLRAMVDFGNVSQP